MSYLIERDLVQPENVVSPIGNRLVFVAAAEAIHPGSGSRDTVLSTLGTSGWLAMGDPDHVPAGIYGRQALEALGLWPQLEPRVVRAENVRAALALVARGEAAGAIVYETDLAAANVQALPLAGVPLVVSQATPVYQFAAVGADRASPSQAFISFLSTQTAAEIFRRRGFELRP